jgi:mono/diheme cytochrome c family protein
MRWSARLTAGPMVAAVLVGTVATVPHACRSEEKVAKAPPSAEPSTGVATVALHPFNGDPKVASEGRALFLRYNCYSCHGGLAGGAMGPSLRDTVWKYGGTDSAIYNSIHDGRPLGMPTWSGLLSPQQIKTLVVYITSLRTAAEPKFFWASETTAAAGTSP